MANILALDDWKVLDRKNDEHDMMITAEYTKSPEFCVRCGVEGAKLLKHGVQEQTFMDTPIHGKRVGIKVQRQRYRCADCKGNFQQLLPDMDEKRTMTRRLLDYIRQRSLERTFTEVSEDVGVNEKTVRNIFTDFVDDLDENRNIVTPNWLGIDELFLIGKPRCMLTNVQERRIVDLLVNRDKKTVTAWLKAIPEPDKVKVVTMDMWRPYRDAANSVLPNARVVVDKFHVVKMANHCLDAVRKSLRDGMDAKQRRKLMHDRHLLLRRRKDLEPIDHMLMDSWTGALPSLLNAYNAKEDFYEVYEKTTDRRDAQELYEVWLGSLDRETKLAFHELIRAVENWKPEIFAYFDHRATNAYTEAVNGITKVINRIGRGYSFHAIRAKVIYGTSRPAKPKFGDGQRQRAAAAAAEDELPFCSRFVKALYEQARKDHGIEIQHVIDEINRQHESQKSTVKSE